MYILFANFVDYFALFIQMRISRISTQFDRKHLLSGIIVQINTY